MGLEARNLVFRARIRDFGNKILGFGATFPCGSVRGLFSEIFSVNIPFCNVNITIFSQNKPSNLKYIPSRT